jgi:hypothetical protein
MKCAKLYRMDLENVYIKSEYIFLFLFNISQKDSQDPLEICY